MTLRCESLGLRNLETLETTEGYLATLSSDNELTLLYQNDDPKSIRISRPYKLYKVVLNSNYIVVVGWSEEKKEASYLLYDSKLQFKDEISVKCCKSS